MSQQVLTTGLDPTSFTSITGAQLAQMVNNATFATGIGGVIVTVDGAGGGPTTPNATSDTTLQTYVWVRLGNPVASSNANSSAVGYVWNPNAANPTDPTQLLNWNPITAGSIAAGSIMGYMIAAATIPASALQGGITSSQVVGLAALFASALTSSSTPNGGAIAGSFGGGFSLLAQAVTAGTIAPGAINLPNLFSGTPIAPSLIDTTASSPAAGSILQAPTGTGSIAQWILNAVVAMGNPGGGQAGYIPVAQSNGTVLWTAPTAAFPAGQIAASAEVTSGSITVTAVAATTNSWICSTANTTGLIASQTLITLSGYGTKYANLNGSWLVTAVSAGVSFTVITTSNIAGSGTTTIGTSKFCNYNATTLSCLNVANSTALVGAGAGAITTYGTTLTVPSVLWNSAGNYTIFFVTPKGNANYIVHAQVAEASSTTSLYTAKVIAKNANYVTIQTCLVTYSGGLTVTPTDVTDLSVTII